MTNNHERRLPDEPRDTPTNAAAGGANRPPHLRAVPSHPDQSPELERLARVVLARVLGRSKSESLAELNTLCQALAVYAREPLPGGDEHAAAPMPDAPRGPWPHGDNVLRRRGVDRAELRRAYLAAEHDDDVEPELPRATLDELVPPVLQTVVARMLAEGPQLAGRRANRSLKSYALRGQTRATKRRGAGPPAHSTIDQRRLLLRRVMHEAVETRALGGGGGLLHAWTFVPDLAVPSEAPSSSWDTTGPSVEAVRHAWAERERRVERDLGVSPRSREAEALIRGKADAWLSRHSRLFIELRVLVLLVLVGGLGLRIGAIAALRRSDFILDHVGPAPDERRGPALRVRPGKALRAGEIRWKPLTDEQGNVVRAYLAFLECHRAAIARRAEKSGRPVDPPSMPADFPLLVATRRTLTPWAPHRARVALTGGFPHTTSQGLRPLIPRSRGISDDLPAHERQFVGYPPHAYRHTAAQLAQRAGELWNAEHPPTGAEPRYEPELYATCLLDHTPKGNRMVALYSDHLTVERYELLSGRAAEGIWRLLTTDDGARREPDWQAVAVQRGVIAGLERDLAEIEGRIDGVLTQRVTTQDTHTAVLQGNELSRLTRIMERDRRRTRDQLADAAQELHRLEHDPARWRLLPDVAQMSAPPQLAAATGDGQPIRDWLTVAEFAEVAGVGVATAYLWLAGRGLQSERPGRPWNAAAIPAESERHRSRRIWLLGIAPTAIPAQNARRLRELLAEWPREQGWLTKGRPGPRCTSRLDLPAGFREAYGASTVEDLVQFLDWLEGER